MDEIQTLGMKIKSLRNINKLSQEDLAYKAGLSVAGLSALELGKGNPTLNTLLSIAKSLNIALSELFKTADAGKISELHHTTLPDGFFDFPIDIQNKFMDILKMTMTLYDINTGKK